MRFAPSVSHRVFERTWHPQGLLWVYLFEHHKRLPQGELGVTLRGVASKAAVWARRGTRGLCGSRTVVLTAQAGRTVPGTTALVKLIQHDLKSGKTTR